jgi:hypothetical protein
MPIQIPRRAWRAEAPSKNRGSSGQTSIGRHPAVVLIMFGLADIFMSLDGAWEDQLGFIYAHKHHPRRKLIEGSAWRSCRSRSSKSVPMRLDVEDRVDAPHRYEGERRDDRELATRLGGDIGELEELAATVRSAAGLSDWPGLRS